jgi:quercetin dioxygenase-like cupin family protein
MNAFFPLSLAITSSLLSGCTGRPTTSSTARHISITHNEPRSATEAFPGSFTGDATVTPFLSPTEQLAASGASVSFERGARTTWHTHPAGQTLFVTSGTGWVQEWDGTKIEVKPGDVIWTPPGVKHWHGATTTSPMTHIAIQGLVAGKNVDWKEPVSDEQYAH